MQIILWLSCITYPFKLFPLNVNGNPILPNWGPGPMEAVEEFLIENIDFVVDKSNEKFFFTSNPRGYLKKIK